MARTFLTAQWRKLIMANYIVDPAMLLPYLPANTALDSFEGKHFFSLVGFMFQDTRLLGFRVPMHVNFEEVNLRFYVYHTDKYGTRKRGVVFIKEIVPLASLCFVANTFYGEHYEALPMHHKWYQSKAGQVVNYRWQKGLDWQKMQVVASTNAVPIAVGTEEEFITEHYWGYTKLHNGRTSEYEVVHPRWEIYPVLRHSIDVDFGSMYGHDFALLNDLKPASVLLAEGSEVTVRAGGRIGL